MKTNILTKLVIFFTVLITLSSCSVIGGIFKTGMGVGAIVVIAIIALVIFLISRAGKK